MPFAFAVFGISVWGWANGFPEQGMIAAQIEDLGARALVLFVSYSSYPILIWGGAAMMSRLAGLAGCTGWRAIMERLLSVALTVVCVYNLAHDLVIVAASS